ncbi:abl interactor 1 [Nilaparvata lugens]|uniref:abl interactor 1 n=1 Tax=Nilaparvata lugens TaxID=108931 RepID=UPI00193E4822|nr:abl interactor 1 [Nilaparvata lugens]
MDAAGKSLEMKVPIRPAPAPPGPSRNAQPCRTSSQLLDDFGNCDPFMDRKFSRSETTLATKKKPPPPRPPPPKLQPKAVNRKQAPTQLLTNIFGRKQPSKGQAGAGKQSDGDRDRSSPNSSLYGFGGGGGGSCYGSTQHNIQVAASNVPSATLIDFNSPPASPTLTARSSSDGVESGFEDDFDFLTSTSSNTTTPLAVDESDPFSPLRRASPGLSMPPTIYEDIQGSRRPPSSDSSFPGPRRQTFKPTIIRGAYTGKPKRPPPMKTESVSKESFDSDDVKANWSPPMPSMPPPPPPPEALDALLNGPQLPPRPTTLMSDTVERKKPYCIAQYDYEATHPDDLSFKVNDVISLISRVNAEWLKGQLMGKEGIFPESFVNVVVALDEQPVDSFDNDAKAIALYTFTPETWDDLSFQEGDTVRILKRVNDDWLYGECGGRRGQFPANFVSSLFPDADS